MAVQAGLKDRFRSPMVELIHPFPELCPRPLLGEGGGRIEPSSRRIKTVCLCLYLLPCWSLIVSCALTPQLLLISPVCSSNLAAAEMR